MTPFLTIAAKLAAQGLPALADAMRTQPQQTTARLAQTIGLPEAAPEVVAQAVDAQDAGDLLALRQLDAAMERERMAHVERATAAARADEVGAIAAQEANIREARLTTDLNPTRLRLLLMITAMLLVGCILLTVAVVRVKEFPAELFGLLSGAIGMVLAKFSSGWDYFFGTSSGSAAKERTAAMERIIAADKR